ncbi:MAG: hypothetical protein V3U24_04465 [Candidatus Neomarinimicrobiota bacterium]
MEVLTKLGLFLVLFAVIVFGSRLLLTKNTKEQLRKIRGPVSGYFQSQSRLLMRLIIVLALVIVGLYIVFELR